MVRLRGGGRRGEGEGTRDADGMERMESSWSSSLITAKDHASVQINIGHLDENGVYTGEQTTYALCGFVRSKVRARTQRKRKMGKTRSRS